MAKKKKLGNFNFQNFSLSHFRPQESSVRKVPIIRGILPPGKLFSGDTRRLFPKILDTIRMDGFRD